MKIVMITGKAGVGKDTYAREHYDDYYHLAFADKLKDMAYALGWDGEKDEKGRKFLQELGDVVNTYDDSFWTKQVAETIRNVNSLNIHKFVITDLRYPHEAHYMFSWFPDADNIEIIELTRDFESGLTDECQKHPSEQGIGNGFPKKVVKL